MQKPAGAFKDVILAVSQDALAVIFDVLREFLLGLFIAQLEAFRQTLDVAFSDKNPLVGATVGRTF